MHWAKKFMWLFYCNICFLAVAWSRTCSLQGTPVHTLLSSFSFTYAWSNNDISQNNISGTVHKPTKAVIEVNKVSTKLRVIRSFTLMSTALFPVTICEKLLLRFFLLCSFVSNKILIIVCSSLITCHFIFISPLATLFIHSASPWLFVIKDNQCF